MASSAFAGTWGSEKLLKLGKTLPSSKSTTYSDQYGDANIKEYQTRSKMTHSKFKALQDANVMILTYEDKNAHSSNDRSSSTIFEDGSVASTTTMNGPKDATPLAMARTQNKLMRTAAAPVAVGRSGHRIEKGINASGLLGERLQLGAEPTKNSFVQRSWLPYDDPALLYKVNGKPEAYVPNDVSLDVGSHTTAVKVGWVHGRKAVFTGDPLSKAGAQRAGIFLDDYPVKM